MQEIPFLVQKKKKEKEDILESESSFRRDNRLWHLCDYLYFNCRSLSFMTDTSHAQYCFQRSNRSNFNSAATEQTPHEEAEQIQR